MPRRRSLSESWAPAPQRAHHDAERLLASSTPMTAEFQVIDLQIPAEMAGQRLDSALARLMPEHSRTRIKGWIEAGAVTVDRAACKPRDTGGGGARVRVQMTL